MSTTVKLDAKSNCVLEFVSFPITTVPDGVVDVCITPTNEYVLAPEPAKLKVALVVGAPDPADVQEALAPVFSNGIWIFANLFGQLSSIFVTNITGWRTN